MKYLIVFNNKYSSWKTVHKQREDAPQMPRILVNTVKMLFKPQNRSVIMKGDVKVEPRTLLLHLQSLVKD